MKRRHKRFIASLFIFFLLPLALGVCCCLDDVFANVFSSPKHHAHHHHHETNKHQHGDHDHGECEHDQLVANVPYDVFLNNHLPFSFSILKKYASHSVSLVQPDFTVDFIDTGPPGSFSSLPLYLEISNLRI